MCQNTQHRRCVGNFAAKYLSGDPVKAKCGATIIVEVIDQATGKAVGQEAVDGLHLEVCSPSAFRSRPKVISSMAHGLGKGAEASRLVWYQRLRLAFRT